MELGVILIIFILFLLAVTSKNNWTWRWTSNWYKYAVLLVVSSIVTAISTFFIMMSGSDFVCFNNRYGGWMSLGNSSCILSENMYYLLWFVVYLAEIVILNSIFKLLFGNLKYRTRLIVLCILGLPIGAYVVASIAP